MITKNNAAYYMNMIGFGKEAPQNSHSNRSPFYDLLKDCNSEEYMRFIKVYKTMQYVLSKREKLVLDKIYGVDSEIEILREIAKEINVTQERVRQIRYKANVKISRELKRIFRI
ncbi:sigma factor-like helix-turn-helix DNA-binding protein [Halobacillus seohaensis]